MQSNPVGGSNSCRPQQSMGFPPPQRSEPLPCPRCDSTATKFCYYNNYNLSQPRYLCKSCRRYWTHGGTLRNVPVGGATRKMKISKKSRTTTSNSSSSSSSSCSLPSTTSAQPPSASATDHHFHMNTSLLSLNSQAEAEASLGFGEFSYGFTEGGAALLRPFSESDYKAWDDDLAWPTLAISTPHHPPNNLN